MDYRIETSAPALNDLYGVTHYIAFILNNPKAADDLLETYSEKLNALCKSPRIYPLSRIKKLAAKGYRRFDFGNYLAFYKIDEENRIVYIVRIFYQKQDYRNFL